MAQDTKHVIVYPGRFQPFHKGHKAVFDHLSGKYDNVYVATSDKVDPPRSPFSFEEKKKMMELTGMDTTNVVMTKAPYVATEITQNFDKENTILMFAVSEKDMAEDPRFTFKPKKDGSPSYFQPVPKDGQMETMDKHGYMITVPTFDFKVLGKPMKSATEIRAMFSKLDTAKQKQLITDLFGNYDLKVHRLLDTKITESLNEGGWEDTITQKTTLTPSVVKAALVTAKNFVKDFNVFLEKQGEHPVEMGHPLGSTAYVDVDDESTEYGDIDLQMIAPELEGKSSYQISKHYNDLIDSFLNSTKPSYYYERNGENKGHPIFKLSEDVYVQIDMLWTVQRLAKWDRYRKTPTRGIKGLITGNLFSTLGEVMNMSIQSAVLMKLKDGEPVNYQKARKPDEVVEITKDIENFGVDILTYVYKAVKGSTKGLKIDPELQKFPGVNTDSVQITDLVHMVKGLAKSFELNGLYGHHVVKDYKNAQDFINTYLKHYLNKADYAGKGAKFDKATTPDELAKVKELHGKIAKGVKIVKKAFSESKRVKRKIKENNKMSSQKLGVFAKGKSKVSLWEHDGTIVMVSKHPQRLQETKGSVKQAVDTLYNRGYVCESVDMTTMKNAAGAIMNVFFDTIKKTTTVRDQQGGSHTYEAPSEKVIAALQKKGFQSAGTGGGGGGLSLEPMDTGSQQGFR